MLIVVPPEAAGERLDSFLAARIGSRAKAQRLIEEGYVTVDGQLRPKRQRLTGGERIEIEQPVASASAEVSADVPLSIVYEDDHLLVVDKPAGVVVHPARGHRAGTLAQALAARGAAGGEPWRAGVVHRLDKGTSGLLVVAKDEQAHRRLKEALAARRIRREYLLLVDGRPPARSGTIDAPIGRDRRVRTRISLDTDVPRGARTHFTLERLLPRTALVRAALETGRTHQIRVHFAAIGHPVCGDPEYGRAGAYGLDRQFLHAQRLAFEHPYSGAAVDLSSPLPTDLTVALARAERDD
jgi:23S rRNA pseudouridine1911/1915/1917 synthase